MVNTKEPRVCKECGTPIVKSRLMLCEEHHEEYIKLKCSSYNNNIMKVIPQIGELERI